MKRDTPSLVILNQMAGPMTWELAVDLGRSVGQIALLTGHPDTLSKGSNDDVALFPSTAYRRGNFLTRSWSWLRYTVHAFFWLWRWPSDVPIVAFTNPPVIIWMCWLIGRLRGTPYTVMVHDIYPDTIVSMGVVAQKNPIARLWRVFNRPAYERATVVMTLGEHMAARLESQFNPARTAAQRIRIVPPWADETHLTRPQKADNWFARKYRQLDCLTVMYSGNMGRGHDVETLLESAERLRDNPRVHFMFIGAGPKWNSIERFLGARGDGPQNVTLLPWQDESVIPFSLTTADLGVVSLEKEMTGLAVPSKAYYFLAAGAPLLGLCHTRCELADTIKRFECGQVLMPGDADAVCSTILQLVRDPDRLQAWRTSAELAIQHHGRAKNTALFMSILSEMKLITNSNQVEQLAS